MLILKIVFNKYRQARRVSTASPKKCFDEAEGKKGEAEGAKKAE
jgi:hypothetical protein